MNDNDKAEKVEVVAEETQEVTPPSEYQKLLEDPDKKLKEAQHKADAEAVLARDLKLASEAEKRNREVDAEMAKIREAEAAEKAKNPPPPLPPIAPTPPPIEIKPAFTKQVEIKTVDEVMEEKDEKVLDKDEKKV